MDRSALVISAVLLASAALMVAVVLAPALPRATLGDDEPSEPEVRITPVRPSPKAKAAAGETALATFSWGTAKSQLGRARPRDGNPEAPMSIGTDASGATWVLDQVASRLVMLDASGRPGAELKVPRTARDFSWAKNGNVAVLDRDAVSVLASDGRALGRYELKELQRATGVVVEGDDVYVEKEHRELTRVGDASGTADAARPTLPGRPTRDGKALVFATITDGAHGSIALASLDRGTQEKRFAREIAFGMPVLKLLLLDTDQSGLIYLAALGERLPPGRVSGDRVATVDVLCLDARDGRPAGRAELPANTSADETVRELATIDSGGVIYLHRTETNAVLQRVECR